MIEYLKFYSNHSTSVSNSIVTCFYDKARNNCFNIKNFILKTNNTNSNTPDNTNDPNNNSQFSEDNAESCRDKY